MRIVMFYHSLLSCWNHGNAHFLRGVVRELQEQGHSVAVYEPRDGWSRTHLEQEKGFAAALGGFEQIYPTLRHAVRLYDGETLSLSDALDGADLVLVHEWNDPALVARIGEYRKAHPRCRVLFHDTHHRAVSDENSMTAYDLTHYDGVLAFGAVIRDLYRERGWAKNVWTWHEAADVRVFRPIPYFDEPEGDLLWIGNWGDEERTAELREFLIEPVRRLGLRATVFGVRYPDYARAELRDAGITYGGWLPNHCAPEIFSRFRVTVHVPRRYYTQMLPGIPTIRVFEALACGIPLISAPWQDAENLFRPGTDFLVARDGSEMEAHLRQVLEHPETALPMSVQGRQTVLARHTCAHRVDELMAVYGEISA
ncbi:MAG: glycosyltransferase [Armatimonadaceae bacterium]